MGRFRDAAGQDAGETAIDMSPLMDCVFILLIFFIVTTTFVEETGIEVDKPQPASTAKSDGESLILEITESNQVLAGGKEIGLGGVGAEVRRQLAVDDEAPVVIQAHKKTKTGMLVRVVDAAKLAGAVKVSVGSSRSRD